MTLGNIPSKAVGGLLPVPNDKCTILLFDIQDDTSILFLFQFPISILKESNSTANESKRQFNRSIIYNLDSIVRVNDNPKL